MEGNVRRCKKCLLREMADGEKLFESVRRMIEDLSDEERASEPVRKDRLAVCKACDRLLEGMCTACGCYVELRTAIIEQSCPYERW